MVERVKRGREGFRATNEQRELVKLYLAGGISEPVIAHRLGMVQNTLRRHFSEELRFGREMKIAENLELLAKAGRAGNVAALKYLDLRFHKVASHHAIEEMMNDEEPRPAKVGKKEAAAAAARAATEDTSSEWGSDLRFNGQAVN